MCYAQALDCFVIGYYYPEGKRPSRLALVDAKSGARIKSVNLLKPGGLPYIGHAGGVAAYKNHIWVTSESRAWRLTAKDLKQAKNGDTLRFRDFFKSESRGSFAFVAEGMLWLGDYYAPVKGEEPPAARYDKDSGNAAWCIGYKLNNKASMGISKLKRNGDSAVPKAMLSIQNYVQGACITSTGELLFSASFSTHEASWLWRYPSLQSIMEQPPAREITLDKQKYPLWVIAADMALSKQILAPMSEGICQLNGRIFTLYESASQLFRKQAELFADHVFALDEASLFPVPGFSEQTGM